MENHVRQRLLAREIIHLMGRHDATDNEAILSMMTALIITMHDSEMDRDKAIVTFVELWDILHPILVRTMEQERRQFN
jgi:hypothetical protein